MDGVVGQRIKNLGDYCDGCDPVPAREGDGFECRSCGRALAMVWSKQGPGRYTVRFWSKPGAEARARLVRSGAIYWRQSRAWEVPATERARRAVGLAAGREPRWQK